MLLNIFYITLLFAGTIQSAQAIKLSSYTDDKCTSSIGTLLIGNNQCISDTEKGTSYSATCQSDNKVLAYKYSDSSCKNIKYTYQYIGDAKTCNFVKADPDDPSDTSNYLIIDCSDKTSISSNTPTIVANAHTPSNANIVNLNTMTYLIIFFMFVLFTNVNFLG